MSATTRVIRVQARFPAAPDISEDETVNVWHFHDDSAFAFPNDLGNVFDMVEDFYTAVPAGLGTSVAGFFSSTVGTDGILTAYSLDDGQPRVPIGERTFTFIRQGSSLPRQAALAVSFQGDQVSAQRQAQRRGRVYVGPWGNSTGTIVTATGRPSLTLLDTLQKSARDLLAASNASVSNSWGVDSPTRRANPSLPQSFTPVTNGWVDNAWDAQRRRGRDPAVRGPFTATTPA